MDCNKASTSTTNSSKPEHDGEINKNHKGPKHPDQSENEERLLISTLNQPSSFVPLNGSRSRSVNPASYESGSQSSRSSENATESHKNLASTSQCSTSSKVNSNDCVNESATASSSRSSLNTNNGVDSNEGQSCQRHRVCLDMAGSTNIPTTSGTSRTSDNDNIPFKENRKRPSSLKLNRPNFNADDSSSDTGNDDYSLGSEDGCIYTYRGGEHLADLPSSFFSLDMGLPLDRQLPIHPNYPVQQQGAGNAREAVSRASSPDMDFLEMDFDPGPSCEVDTGDESTPDADLEAVSNMPEEIELEVRVISPEDSGGAECNPVLEHSHADDVYCYAVPSTSRGVISSHGDAPDVTRQTYGPYITHTNVRGEQLLVRRTMTHLVAPASLHITNGDLIPREIAYSGENFPEGSLAHQISQRARASYETNPTVPAAIFHILMAEILMAEKKKHDDIEGGNASEEPSEPVAGSSTACISCIEPPRCMIWPEREACERQVTQIGTSACGSTAVVNVFNALGVPVNVERINQSVGTRLRANSAPLPRYILSRAVAGCTAADLVNGIHRASDGLVTARFFATYPERAMSLSHWLADWISIGAVPILTLNLQVGCEGEIPDAWHHQMVFGVSSRGVFLCNPVECVRENVLWSRLAAPSVLLIRARDIVERSTNTTDLTPLLHVPDQRFHAYNVLGQVVNVLREWRAVGWRENLTRTRHVRIPAAYQAGVTVAALTGSEAHRRLILAAQLPLLSPQKLDSHQI